MTGSAFRLDSLHLQNFRCFSDLHIELHPELTVLVADNGGGKTAVLDAAALAVDVVVDTLLGSPLTLTVWPSDIHLVRAPQGAMERAFPAGFTACGVLDTIVSKWGRVLKRGHARTTTKDAKPARDIAKTMRSRVLAARSGALVTTLPVIASYGTGRLWSEHRLTQRRSTAAAARGRLSGYLNCLSPSSSFKTLVSWYAGMSTAVRGTVTSGVVEQHRPERLLAAVREATQTVLEPTGWAHLDWSFDRKELVVEHPVKGVVPLAWLSDGVRNMIALVADLSRRCVTLNPQFGESAAARTPGIVMIDEVDMHLHPSWQQLIIGLLRRAFPAVQFILTTHSPQVLTTVSKENIRVLDHEDLVRVPSIQTEGHASAFVLSDVFGVNPTPAVPVTGVLHEYSSLVEAGHSGSEQGMKLRGQLEEHFGPQHPLLLACDTRIRFLHFRAKAYPQNSPEQGKP